MQSEGPVSRVGWLSEGYVDYDRNKTCMAASESLTTNKNFQEVLYLLWENQALKKFLDDSKRLEGTDDGM